MQSQLSVSMKSVMRSVRMSVRMININRANLLGGYMVDGLVTD